MSPTPLKPTAVEKLGKMNLKRLRVRKIGNYVKFPSDLRLSYYVKGGYRIMNEDYELAGFENNQYAVVRSDSVIKHLNTSTLPKSGDISKVGKSQGETKTMKPVPIRDGLRKRNLCFAGVKSPDGSLVNNNISLNQNKDPLISPEVSPPRMIKLEPAPASIIDNVQTIELITKPTAASSRSKTSPDDFVELPDSTEPLLGGNGNPTTKLLSAVHLEVLSKMQAKALNLSMKRQEGIVSIGVQTDEVIVVKPVKDQDVQTESPCNKSSLDTYDPFSFDLDVFGDSPLLNDVNFGHGPTFPTLAIDFNGQTSNNMGHSTSGEHDRKFYADGSKESMFFKVLRECLTYNIEGNLPIHEGVMHNSISLVQQHCVALKIRNESINLENHSGCNPLQLAIIHNADIKIVELLLNAGANIKETDADGNNIFHLLAQFQRLDMLKLILEHCKLNRLFDCANRHNFNGLTPLMICCESSWTLGAQHFLKAGVKVDLKDLSSGRTALFHAAEDQNVEMVKLLLDNKADPKIKNFFGTSPHDAMYEVDDIDECIKSLIFGKSKKRSHEAELNPMRTAKAVKSLKTFSKLHRLDPKTIVDVETASCRGVKHKIQRQIK